ncbi:MAG: NUDIX hydrolase [Clostridia bacterium]|nr:NUDIX hydrolase [Clostridia bacterium]
MQNTIKLIENYIPYNEQETRDKEVFLNTCKIFPNLLTRENDLIHVCSNAFILNKQHTKVLCAHHNIYNSWGWVGGHADGLDDLMQVAEIEAHEETSIHSIIPLSNSPISIDILTTEGHIKKGKYVSGHLHFVTAFLFEADENQPIQKKEDENSAVAWIKLEELPNIAREPQMKVVYKKIIERIKLEF